MPIEHVHPTSYHSPFSVIQRPIDIIERDVQKQSVFNFHYLYIHTGTTHAEITVNLPTGISYVSVFNLTPVSLILRENEQGNMITNIPAFVVLTIPLPPSLPKITLEGFSDGRKEYKIPFIISSERETFVNFGSSIREIQPTNIRCINQLLFSKQTLIWDGVTTSMTTSDIPPAKGESVMFIIENSTTQELKVTFLHKVNEVTYLPWYDGTGAEVSFKSPANTTRIYGPIQKFPRFEGGRLVFSSNTAPPSNSTTSVVIQEV